MSDYHSTTVMSKVGPDLLTSPHILPALIEVLAGEQQQLHAQQEQLVDHLITCHYCRTAVMALLCIAREHDHQNDIQEKAALELLERFANISRKIEAIEAYEDERLGMFAEAIVDEGRDKAAAHFPDIAAHLKICPDCCSVVEETVAFIKESSQGDHKGTPLQ